jgi:hypothetical protein
MKFNIILHCSLENQIKYIQEHLTIQFAAEDNETDIMLAKDALEKNVQYIYIYNEKLRYEY